MEKIYTENNKKREKNFLQGFMQLLMIAAAIGFYVNRSIIIKGLYMDDLYMWSCYGEQSLLEFAFPIGTSTRFRPVYWLLTYLQMAIIGTHIDRFAAFNIIINIAVALELFYMAKRFSRGSELTGFITALCYLASRFAYYQIGQALGLMETTALAMSVLTMYLLMKACGLVPEKNHGTADLQAAPGAESEAGFDKRSFFAALTVYFLLAFVHERYISLFPLFYLALITELLREKRGDRLKGLREKGLLSACIMPLVTLTAIAAIRVLAIGKALPAGTGGTEVTDTFSISQSVGFCFDQVLYIFGVNAGPEYLCGLSWEESPWQIKRAVKLGILFIGLICILFLITLLRECLRSGSDAEKKRHRFKDLSFIMMICSFMALCIGCSSVTIRLEMRWIYVSYSAALLFAAYMLGAIKREWQEKAVRGIAIILFILYAFFSIGTNIFYRGYFTRIYFWADQLRMNSLYEETVGKYGTDGIFGKTIYIIDNSYGMSDFYAGTFFKPYDPEKKAEGTSVIFAESITDVPAEEVREGRAYVLIELPEENAYKDITDEIK